MLSHGDIKVLTWRGLRLHLHCQQHPLIALTYWGVEQMPVSCGVGRIIACLAFGRGG